MNMFIVVLIVVVSFIAGIFSYGIILDKMFEEFEKHNKEMERTGYYGSFF